MQTNFDTFFTSLAGKQVAVLGHGVSNRPLVRLLLSYGCNVTGCDKRQTPDGELTELEQLGCRLQLGESYLENLTADLVFRTPGMPPDTPALEKLRQQGAEVTSEMGLFFRLCPCTIIAVTGSDGKTTTTTLISEMLKAAGKRVWLGGNIGTPLLPLCPQMEQTDYAVVELSSFQLLDMQASPHVAVITNLSPNHLDVHKDMAEYVWAKQNIYRYQSTEDILILNRDNPLTDGCEGCGITKKFSRKGRAHVWSDGAMIYRDDTPVLATEEILLPGAHNVENYMAAILAVEGLVSDEAIGQVARTFGGVAHRCELVRVKDGVSYYNDSIASSPSRTVSGLRSFRDPVLLIAGGYDKNLSYDDLAPEICSRVKTLFLNGATADKIRQAVEGCPGYTPGHPEIVACGDFTDAVKKAAVAAVPGDIVLMSPASASFDQFRDFAERGNYFKSLIKEL